MGAGRAGGGVLIRTGMVSHPPGQRRWAFGCGLRPSKSGSLAAIPNGVDAFALNGHHAHRNGHGVNHVWLWGFFTLRRSG